MRIFGWSYPPGVSSVPGDEPWVADLTPYVTLRGDADGVFWDEDNDIIETFPILVKTDDYEYVEGDYRLVGNFPWNDDLSDEENLKAAGAYYNSL